MTSITQAIGQEGSQEVIQEGRQEGIQKRNIDLISNMLYKLALEIKEVKKR